MVFSIDIFLIFILYVLLSLPLFPVILILIANVQTLFNLIGQEEYNIGRNILNIGINIVLFGEKNLATFEFRGTKKKIINLR